MNAMKVQEERNLTILMKFYIVKEFRIHIVRMSQHLVDCGVSLTVYITIVLQEWRKEGGTI